jgi:argininosuccinate lyase
MKGLPAGYNKDLQEDKEAIFDAEDTWVGCLRAVSSVIGGLTPNAAVSARAASGLLLATDVADYLVAKGLPFRDAHEVVGALVRRLIDEKRSFDDLSLAEWRQHSPLFGEDVKQAVTPLASIRKKQTPQSTSPAAVAAALADTKDWLARQLPTK